MKKYIAALTLLFSLISTLGYSQIDLNAFLSGSVGEISFVNKNKGDSMWSGTGTMMYKKIDSFHINLFLVTNDHVLPKFAQNDSIVFKIRNFNAAKKSFFEFKIGIYDKKGNLLSNIKKAKNGIDIAVIELSESSIPSGLVDSTHAISVTWLADRTKISTSAANIGGEVFYIGYPSSFYDVRNMNPIFRVGYISTSPSDDFYFNPIYRNVFMNKSRTFLPEKFDGFLIDGNVLHGSSGSLVFFNPWRETATLEKDGSLSTNFNKTRRIMILGVLSDAYFDLSDMTKANIGGVISAEYIKLTIDLF